MTVIILVQLNESAAWTALPGTYSNFQEAREMAEFLRLSYGPDASFGIEHADDVARKGWTLAAA